MQDEKCIQVVCLKKTQRKQYTKTIIMVINVSKLGNLTVNLKKS